MSIEKGSKWVKDGEVVEVIHIGNIYLEQSFIQNGVIIVNNKKEKIIVDNESFLEQYKPYEVVYEYQWAYKRSTDSIWSISDIFYLDTPYLTRDEAEYQRLEFTKRERK